MNYVFSTENGNRYRFPTHTNELILDRSQCEASEVFVVILAPGESPPLHEHSDTEQIFYILEGEGVLTIGGDTREFGVRPGDVVRIPVAVRHAIRAGGGPLRYIAVDCFPGGRPVAEPTWDAHVRAVCRRQGWDYDAIVQGSPQPANPGA